jgi:hypothetical protein
LGIYLYVVSLSSYIPEYWAYVVPYCLLWIYHYIWAYVLPLRTYIQLYWEYVVAILFMMIIPVYWAYIVPCCLLWKYQYIGHTLCRCVLIYGYIGHTLCNIVYYEFTSIFGHTLCHVFFKSIPGIRCAIFLFTYQYIRRMLCYLVFYFIYIYIIYLGIPLCHMLTHANTTCTCTWKMDLHCAMRLGTHSAIW